MSFYQWLKDKLARGEEPRYIVTNPTKPRIRGANLPSAKLRGIGWTREDKSKDKVKRKRRRKMAQASRRRNR